MNKIHAYYAPGYHYDVITTNCLANSRGFGAGVWPPPEHIDRIVGDRAWEALMYRVVNVKHHLNEGHSPSSWGMR
jgi:hypothetical protein